MSKNADYSAGGASGHSEYDRDTLDREYKRDKAKGLDSRPPVNYYRENNPLLEPVMCWKGHAHLLFSNWLNYFVYQKTPFDLQRLGK